MDLEQLEEAVNEVSDKDWCWWPFLWLRPEKHAVFSLARIVSLSALYGVPLSLLMVLGLFLFGAPSDQELVLTSASFPLQFLFIGSLVVAPMWNRRANRLRARRAAL
jgi:hypothetical protein